MLDLVVKEQLGDDRRHSVEQEVQSNGMESWCPSSCPFSSFQLKCCKISNCDLLRVEVDEKFSKVSARSRIDGPLRVAQTLHLLTCSLANRPNCLPPPFRKVIDPEPAGMDSSPFIKLPREIRDQIYVLALTTDGSIKVDLSGYCGQRPRVQDTSTHQHILALTSTCQQIRAEALPIFCNRNAFEIMFHPLERPKKDKLPYPGTEGLAFDVTHSWPATLALWLRTLGQKNISHIKRIQLNLYCYFSRSWMSGIPPYTSEKLFKEVVVAPVATIARLFSHLGMNCSVRLMVLKERMNLGSNDKLVMTFTLPLCYDQQQASDVVERQYKGQQEGLKDGLLSRGWWDSRIWIRRKVHLFVSHVPMERAISMIWEQKGSSANDFRWIENL